MEILGREFDILFLIQIDLEKYIYLISLQIVYDLMELNVIVQEEGVDEKGIYGFSFGIVLFGDIV